MTATLAPPQPITRAGAADELLRRRRARRSLEAFTAYTMPDYEVNWHHSVVCDYLDRFAEGEIKRLMVFMPPRHGKSELVSRRLPAYLLGRNPDAHIIATSYGDDLASRMNRDVQRIIDSDEYRALFPATALFGKNIRTTAHGSYLRNSDIFEIVGHKGSYRGAGIGSGITGMGANYGLIDDPIKDRKEADSPTFRERVWEWYTSTFYTRLEKGAGIILTLTRWHEDDLAGRLLEQADKNPEADQWMVIRFPARFEGVADGIDQRAEEGEPLWPGKKSDEELTKIEVQDPRQWDALYQQRPTSPGGQIFKAEWWSEGRNRYNAAEDRTRNLARERWIFWDTAFKDQEANDFTAYTAFEVMPDYSLTTREVYQERIESHKLPALMEEVANRYNKDGKLSGLVVEDKGSGITAIQTLRASAPEWLKSRIYAFAPNGSKEYRARQASIWAGRDLIQLPHPSEAAPWLADFAGPLSGELFRFPRVAHDDRTDSFVMGILYLENYLQQAWASRTQPEEGRAA